MNKNTPFKISLNVLYFLIESLIYPFSFSKLSLYWLSIIQDIKPKTISQKQDFLKDTMSILDGSFNKEDTSITLDKYIQNLYGLLNEKFSSILICSHH